MLVWRLPAAPVCGTPAVRLSANIIGEYLILTLLGFLESDHSPRMSRQSGLSANDKGDNEMIQGAVHIWYLPYS